MSTALRPDRQSSLSLIRRIPAFTHLLLIPIAAGALLATRADAQRTTSRDEGNWPSYRRDLAGTGFSPLKQITRDNVATLSTAWTYRLQALSNQDARGPSTPNSQATPVVVNGTMYLPAADRVVALQADTGKEVWTARIAGGTPSRRGVAYWPGDRPASARVFVTSGRRLIALDARTGAPADGFGAHGEVDLVVPYNSVPGVFRNVIVVGANTPPGAPGGIGNPRAYDARTGAKLWEFNSVAQPGDVGHDTWDGDSWKGRLGVNAWPFYFTFDEQRNTIYVPLASPIPGSYGGDRKGANLYGNSIVALDATTGRYKWHFQTIHHDLWDHDPPAPPTLFNIVRNGRTIPALGVTTKSGYLYVLNRETGQPVFGVEEQPMPASDVPGEHTFPTQPIPVKPPALARTGFDAADLVTAADTTAEHAQACADLVQRLGGVVNKGPFTPWGLKTTLLFPGTLGGPNWGGAAYDPNSGYLIIATQDVGALGTMTPTKPGADVPYDKTSPPRQAAFDVRIGDVSWPCQKPPWGRLVAVNAATGDIAWQVPLGITEQLPAAKQRTGRPVLAGAVVTASGLLFIGSTDDNRFRALDIRNGTELWTEKLEHRGNADPVTYLGSNGRQYVAIAATDTLMVYALKQ